MTQNNGLLDPKVLPFDFILLAEHPFGKSCTEKGESINRKHIVRDESAPGPTSTA